MVIKLVVILSEQRSGSTFLSEAVARALPCAVALGEPLLQQSSGGGYLQWSFADALDTGLRNRRSSNPLAWLRHVRKHACASRKCACVGVVKLFRTHRVYRNGLHRLVGAPDVASVVLERNAVEVECSLRWAKRTSDWANTPHERNVSGSLAGYRSFQSSCVPTVAFAALHNRWYAHLRNLHCTVRVGFSELIYDTAQALRRIGRALNETITNPQNLTESLEFPRISVPRPTIALIVIVRRHPERLAPWLAHHARSGVDEVAIYSTPETRVSVARIVHIYEFPTNSQRTLRTSVSVRPVADAVAASGGALWSYSWKTCQQCCNLPLARALVREAPIDGMCSRRMYMPEQAHAVRHAVTRIASSWLLYLDLDEYLAADGSAPDAWRTYLATLGARRRRPGGVRLTQLQMIGSLNETIHLAGEPARWNVHKVIVRTDALHENPHAFGSVHEVTLKRGEFYVTVSPNALALLHYRYLGLQNVESQARLHELGCEDVHHDKHLALICRYKRAELSRWATQLVKRPRVRLLASRAPETKTKTIPNVLLEIV